MSLRKVGKPLKRLRALVIDDEPEGIAGTLSLLRRNGLDFTIATSVKSAENAIRRERFDFLIVDMRLPEDDEGALQPEAGRELALRLLDGEYGVEKSQTNFLIVSAQNRSVNRQELNRKGTCVGIYGKLSHNVIVNEVIVMGEEMLESKEWEEA